MKQDTYEIHPTLNIIFFTIPILLFIPNQIHIIYLFFFVLCRSTPKTKSSLSFSFSWGQTRKHMSAHLGNQRPTFSSSVTIDGWSNKKGK